jgi:5-methylcytosine-specific restriction protein A
MSPVIRVDADVWEWLKTRARPLEDTPNTVLRRIAGLDGPLRGSTSDRQSPSPKKRGRNGRFPTRGQAARTNYGRRLNKEWKVGAKHALYHKDGDYYNHLTHFPGALFDPHGYVVFKTQREYENSPYLSHGVQLHVHGGISNVPGYVKVK